MPPDNEEYPGLPYDVPVFPHDVDEELFGDAARYVKMFIEDVIRLIIIFSKIVFSFICSGILIWIILLLCSKFGIR